MVARRRRLPLAGTVTLIVSAVLLAGCGTPLGSGSEHAAARGAVADVVRHLERERTDLIEDYARWADDETADSSAVELIGIEAFTNADAGDPVGALQFRSTVRIPYGLYGTVDESSETYVACFEAEFNYWGIADKAHWGDDAEVARDMRCPDGAQRITPPADTRPVYVVPDGAEEFVVQVLTQAPAEVTVAELLDDLVAGMPQPTGEREVPFEPLASAPGDGRIGIAMGDEDGCLLVLRNDIGVHVLHVPQILLQPGELGCRPKTALLRADQLRSPH
ncbi:hypothetical protein Xcel_1746 [Xylanimonas cellulosilytica DSM 15894]|uniref:Lipoprotein n=1 Tax=Xylanimonas cellulosilytica (strain DSM 15894 / JCM 12276 / CECT 5975 / KCTC 9989 / LMG 20990 / NBRC 107835 / XIL07) TaxID=446471 RepID=D1BSS7_XYLCX|nr:hypothetical protein [Xylanimonas cellulosilytica]ACZ30769.1 hypothetical protein Xcel_1746 [Xylanimonas cellulosilytica DSM 15894]